MGKCERGRVLVRFVPEGLERHACACLHGAEEPISGTYCCGGRIKHHLQIALGRPLTVELRSSALSTGGKRPCGFYFSLVHEAGGASSV